MRFTALAFLGLIAVTPGSAQVSLKDSAMTLPMVQIMASYQFPEGDLVKRFGNFYSVGGGFSVKTASGFLYGVEGMFISGNAVKENQIIDHLKSKSGFLIAPEGMAMDVFLSHRGYTIQGRAGYMFPVLRANPNSGPFITIGSGYWQHKIRIEQKYGETVALNKEYRKGYDRLSSGLIVSQMAGYHFLSSRRLINVFVAVEFNQGFLQGRRTLNYDTGLPGNEKRRDLSWGFRVGWAIPIYRNVSNKVYYY